MIERFNNILENLVQRNPEATTPLGKYKLDFLGNPLPPKELRRKVLKDFVGKPPEKDFLRFFYSLENPYTLANAGVILLVSPYVDLPFLQEIQAFTASRLISGFEIIENFKIDLEQANLSASEVKKKDPSWIINFVRELPFYTGFEAPTREAWTPKPVPLLHLLMTRSVLGLLFEGTQSFKDKIDIVLRLNKQDGATDPVLEDLFQFLLSRHQKLVQEGSLKGGLINPHVYMQLILEALFTPLMLGAYNYSVGGSSYAYREFPEEGVFGHYFSEEVAHASLQKVLDQIK